MEIYSTAQACMTIYEDVGTGILLHTIFESLNHTLLSPHSIDLWARHFKNNCIGGYVKFRRCINGIDFYCTWKEEKIASINFKGNQQLQLSL